MFKTCISVASVGKAPDIVKKMIDDIGWPISTIVIELGRVSFYFCYKWFQYYKVQAFKKAVKRCEERCKYYYKPDIYGKLFTQETRQSSKEFAKATTRLANAGLQGNPEGEIVEYIIGENIEYIVGENGDTIGCKISVHNNLRRN